MSDVKILIACHKDTALLKSNVLLPIQVGAAQGEKNWTICLWTIREKIYLKKIRCIVN